MTETRRNVKNRTLFHGDNLEFLRGINSETIDLIATDPPFNKGRDFHSTPDSLAVGAKFQDRWSWEDDVHQEWIDQIRDDHPRLMEAIEGARTSHSDGMGAFLCFMAVRLIAMHRILKPTGSIYLHCDPTASHYLKNVMDAIFAHQNFQNEFIWYYGGGGASKKRWARKHDVLLFYTKGSTWTFNTDAVRVPHKWTKDQPRADGSSRSKKGKLADDVWQHHSVMPWSKERTGYPTQKPLALYERIILASSNPGDLVLDPFCGCATTLVAAERLGRQWIGMDLWFKARKPVLDRLKNDAMLTSEGEEANDLLAETVKWEDKVPKRTDDGQTNAPYLRVKVKVQEPPGEKWSRQKMYDYLLEQHGMKCQGCARVFDDPRYLQLDHNTPRADGGINHISNRILLCGPCNQLKSNIYTLSGLQRENRKRGYMVNAGK